MVRVPQIIGNSWFNSKPLTKNDLEGKVVLVDFFTYSCINCQRTLPYLAEWWEKYKDKGLVIIGVHTPEFEFEKDHSNVEQALKDSGISWPVVLDNDYVNWNAFANRSWPAKYLIDKKGYITYQHFGEGAYQETEKHIQHLLMQDTSDIDMPPMIEDEHTHGKVCYLATPETYCGHNRGKLFEQEYVEEEVAEYEKSQDIAINSIALDGKFFASGEYVESREDGAELILHFTATEVNLVLEPAKSHAVILVKFNGENIELDMKGYDVTEGGEIILNKSKLYNLIKSNELLDGILTIRAVEGNFRAYAFTFSGCQE